MDDCLTCATQAMKRISSGQAIFSLFIKRCGTSGCAAYIKIYNVHIITICNEVRHRIEAPGTVRYTTPFHVLRRRTRRERREPRRDGAGALDDSDPAHSGIPRVQGGTMLLVGALGRRQRTRSLRSRLQRCDPHIFRYDGDRHVALIPVFHCLLNLCTMRAVEPIPAA
jgi:hypothetical protein